MLKIICFLLFLIHNFGIFKYSASINTNTINKYSIYYFCQILNLFLISIFLFFDLKISENIFMILYFLIILIEFRFVFVHDGWLKNLFGVCCFSVNFFSLNVILISLYSIIFKTSLYAVTHDYKTSLILLIITLIFSNIYLLIFLFLFPLKNMDIMMSNRENLKLCVSILISLFIFLIANTYLFNIKDDFIWIPFLSLKIGICSVILFLATIQYSYLFSRLQLYVIKAENMEKELMEEELILNNLKNEALYDDFTSCFKRDFIYEKIDELLKGIPYFCIAFIDIDGLKITNDIYGHDEGDFYIKTVADILKKEFVGKVVARIGGDEFLILLNLTDIYATKKCLSRCYDKVLNISKEFKKPYLTSISYGAIQITPDNTLSREELIKIADEQMYKFKKVRKKNRK